MTEWSESWYRAQRRRVRLAVAPLAISGVVLVVVPLLFAVLLGMVPPVSPAARFLAVLSGVLAFVMVFGMLLQGRNYLRERRVLREVPAADGALCPKCRRVLAEWRCTRCVVDHDAETVRDHWEQYPHRGVNAEVGGGARLWRAIQNNPWIGVAIVIAMWIVLGAGWAIAWRDSVIVSGIRFSNMLFIALGALLVRLGAKRHVGDAMYCAACDYEKADAGAGDKCPECGAEWGHAGALVRGRVVKSRPLLALGLAVFLLYPTSMFLAIRPGALASVTPTWLLLEQVEGRQAAGRSCYRQWPLLATRQLSPEQDEELTRMLIHEITAAPRGFVSDEWAMLGLRALSPQQHRTLVDGLVRKRTDRGYLTMDDRVWLEEQLYAGTVPTDLVRRVRDTLGK